ncbi:caspase family protein [Alphaproteobacteria bacterium]|nr:caspase family protein [Alphaproteobacteria bacterium]
MKNFVFTFLVGALVVFGGFGGFGVALADSLSCKRTTSSSLAFTSSSAFDSWFPKTLDLDDAGFQSISGKKSMVLRIGERKYQLLPNGKLIAELAEQTGYKSVGAIRYKCNRNSIQVAQSNEDGKSSLAMAAFDYNWDIFAKRACVGNDKALCGLGDKQICSILSRTSDSRYLGEAKRRGLSCGVKDSSSTQVASTSKPVSPSTQLNISSYSNDGLCRNATSNTRGIVEWHNAFGVYKPYVQEAKRRGLSCGVRGSSSTQVASVSTKVEKPAVSSAELVAERQKRIKLEQKLAALEAQQQKQQQTISSDTQIPLITITQSGADGRKGIIKGFAKDNVQVAEVLINGEAVNVAKDGSFEWSGFVPASGKDINIEAIDTAALSSTQVIRLERGQIQQASGPRFDDLDPTSGRRVVQNDNALALIVGISDYERTDAPAIYADKDAEYFHDYASLKLGIPDSNITTMVNDKAEQGDVILAVKDWMRRSSKPGKTDVYVFFAGHGLASDDGEQMYLLPFDGRPRLLDKTAILREELFDDIASANPRSVTVFLDTCYSGTTRGTDMLIASRPIALKALKQSLPDNFTVLTAAAGDQTAKPLEEAKHGMFSYFLMKGMEGDADANQDNQITAGELHAYVQENVVQQSSGSQTPELQGDAESVLVRFQ